MDPVYGTVTKTCAMIVVNKDVDLNESIEAADCIVEYQPQAVVKQSRVTKFKRHQRNYCTR